MNIIKLTILAGVAGMAYFVDLSPATSPVPLEVQFVSEAQAILGVRRRAVRRGVVVGYAAAEGAEAGAVAQQQAVTAEQQAATAQQQSATAQQQSATAHHEDAAAKTAAAGALALGTVVSTLPGGCEQTASGGVEYYHCGANYYRAVFQGNNLVYVTASP